MNNLFDRICNLISGDKIRISEHGYDELADDGLTAREILAGVFEAVVVEEYLDYPKGPCSLLLQRDPLGEPVHVVWGIPKNYDYPVVLVTAYRPNPERWDEKFLERR
ncbi:MAG: DUF4258 domain-containing protein [Proteobacteria bacterium]|nr:DUF4258 domain-containing protein [Pseudomonadota bacterium]